MPRIFLAATLIPALLCACGSLSPWTPARTGPSGALHGKRILRPVEGPVSRGFGDRAGGGRHAGLDILAPPGTEVRAAERGRVGYAGSGLRGYGNAVILEHGDGVTTLYGHLAVIRVKSGDTVPAGAVLGTVGRTGNATTDHLHFELRFDGEAADPTPHFAD